MSKRPQKIDDLNVDEFLDWADQSSPEEIESAVKTGFISSDDTEKRGAPEYPPATPKPSRTISVYY